jgi:hypothetical protein
MTTRTPEIKFSISKGVRSEKPFLWLTDPERMASDPFSVRKDFG